jgi:hypothetical protein
LRNQVGYLAWPFDSHPTLVHKCGRGKAELSWRSRLINKETAKKRQVIPESGMNPQAVLPGRTHRAHLVSVVFRRKLPKEIRLITLASLFPDNKYFSIANNHVVIFRLLSRPLSL